MKYTPNKYFYLNLLFLGYSGFAIESPPPPPAGTPPPPGFPIDGNLTLLVIFGVIFSFLFFRDYIKSTKKVKKLIN